MWRCDICNEMSRKIRYYRVEHMFVCKDCGKTKVVPRANPLFTRIDDRFHRMKLPEWERSCDPDPEAR